jgi:endonuclease/exonuclease/phosphatase family metal-dependent hydrolase
MRSKILIGVLVFSYTGLSAQNPVYTHSFGNNEKYHTIRSPFGTALDLTGSSPERNVLQETYPLPKSKISFSVLLWVKADKDIQQSYSILSSFRQSKESNTGWKIGVQANGAWYWSVDDDKNHYDYYPTPTRQTIKDGNWHQLAFSYDAVKEEAWLYYDGVNVAIIYLPGFTKIAAERLLIGGEIKGDINEWETFNGCIDEVQLFEGMLTPVYIKQTYQKVFPKRLAVEKQSKNFSVMNYNIWHGGRETGRETGVRRIVDIIKSSGADIISMQETYGSGPAIADALGYYFYLRSSNLSIMSRYPIEETTDSYEAFYNGGAFIRLSNNKKILFFTNWLNYPFDYWDLLEKGKTIDREYWLQQQITVNAQRLKQILEKIKPYSQMADSMPVIFCGDFNSGSHLDWIESTKQLNNGYVLPFPTSIVMEKSGFRDSFREIHPDPLKERGITWSPTFTNAFQDRIDYIYYKGNQIKPVQSFTISKHPVKYPSDHAAVVTVFRFK